MKGCTNLQLIAIVANVFTNADGKDFLSQWNSTEDETVEYGVPDLFDEWMFTAMTAHAQLQEPGAIRRFEELAKSVDPPPFHASEDEMHEAAKTSFSRLVHNVGLDKELTSAELQQFSKLFEEDVAGWASRQHVSEEASESTRRSLWQSVVAKSIIESQPVITERGAKLQDEYNRRHGLAYTTGVADSLQHHSVKAARKLLGLLPPVDDRRLRALSECVDFSGLYTWERVQKKSH
jgi:hypothetical protein